jgi:hypothetical protein
MLPEDYDGSPRAMGNSFSVFIRAIHDAGIPLFVLDGVSAVFVIVISGFEVTMSVL